MSFTDEDKAWLSERFAFERSAAKADLERFATKVDLERVVVAFNEALERVETRLLTEFHKWASPMEMRQRTHTATLKALDAEMEYIQDRVTKLEGNKAS